MKNFKKLSREELKNVFGGKGCKLVVANANGTYTTYSGVCKTPVTLEWVSTGLDTGGFYPVASGPSFCDTGDGVAHNLSSNGGVSRC
jgi:hypothetical protein